MQYFKQTTKYTCAAVSLGMIISHFKKDFRLDQDVELDIWHRTAALPTRGSSLYALAIYAHEQGVPLKVRVAEPEYKFPGYKFKAYKKKEIELADRISTMFYNRAKEAGIEIDETDFTLDDVKKLLDQGKILLLRLIIGIVRGSKENKRNPHYLPIYAYSDGNFKIMDPRKGPVTVHEAIVQEAFDKVKEVKRDNRMIIFG